MDDKYKYVSPYFSRPWMSTYGVAAPAGGSNKGMKGIIAGEIFENQKHTIIFIENIGMVTICRYLLIYL